MRLLHACYRPGCGIANGILQELAVDDRQAALEVPGEIVLSTVRFPLLTRSVRDPIVPGLRILFLAKLLPEPVPARPGASRARTKDVL